MTVSELAKRTGVTADTIRHYVRTGLLTPARDPNNGYKRFSTTDQHRLQFIIQAKSLGFSLPDIHTIFDQASHGESPCPQVREIMIQRMQEVAEKLEKMQQTYQTMQDTMKRWETQPNCVPTGDHICHLIEGFDQGECCRE